MRRSQYGLSVSTILAAAANLLVPLAILTFAAGFFPYKPLLAGLAHYDNTMQYGQPPPAPFDRVVFMLVDALRSDFVFAAGSGFEFTQSLIRDGAAMPFTAHAASPTVTMPRLKAITTGSIPSFLDVILNLDEADTSSTLSAQDTWLAQMKAKQTGKLLMYGDDTWLKLFPDTFDRADGTSSFFVSDFTEVDNNVTRHVAGELQQEDWNTMILHYLGLDHIGHKAGPRSSNMVPKQREMDAIVRQIYEALESEAHLQSTLLVLCGDHGMNDAGNHGASSAGETSPALVFMSPKLKAVSKPVAVPAPFNEDFRYYAMVEQSDLAPTLGALLGFPVPKNNLGALILDFLPLWPDDHHQRQLLLSNAKQVYDIVTAASDMSMLNRVYTDEDCSQLSTTAEELVCGWQAINRMSHSDSDWNGRVYQWLQKAQELMSSMASNYDMSKLIQGTSAAAVALLLSTASSAMSVGGTMDVVPFALITLLYGIMMFASSYVEEEQHFWYWSASAWLLYLVLTRKRGAYRVRAPSAVAVLLTMRLIRGWNQTGQKFAGEPDIVKLFMAPNPQFLWSLITVTYATVGVRLIQGLKGVPWVVSVPWVSALVSLAFSFKLAFANEDAPELVTGVARTLLHSLGSFSLVSRARAVFLGLATTSAYPVYRLATGSRGPVRQQHMRTLHSLYTLLALTQSRATNAPVFLLFQTLHGFLERFGLSTVEITISSLTLQMASFFALGGSNAISSVDLSSAYNGVSGYSVVAVGVLTFLSNWAGPVWWMSATNLLLLQKAGLGGQRTLAQHMGLLSVFVAASLVFVMAACTALRTHLFIWTVFSPKYLYSMAWSLGQHLVVNVGLGGLLFWIGRG